MALSPTDAVAQAKKLLAKSEAERTTLDEVRRYWTGRQYLPNVVPRGAPKEVYQMARMSRVNIVSLVVESMAQSLFVEGFRGPKGDAKAWDIWQANGFDAMQSGLHRDSIAYGTGYVIVLPGKPGPVLRPRSPRMVTALYDDVTDEWPIWALERRDDGSMRLYDETSVYELVLDDHKELVHKDTKGHDAGVVPIVRFREVIDLDAGSDVSDQSLVGLAGGGRRFAGPRLAAGAVSPLMALQDQIDLITFNLLVAQHYGAFRQRFIIGWLADDEKKKAEASAARLWTFDDPNVKPGQLDQTDLTGYIDSREAALRHAANLSQTPAHELIGQLVNLSAEALVAAEAGRDRKVADRQTLFGESHEQMLRLAAGYSRMRIAPDAQVVWRQTSARAFAAVVDGLGKLATMLGIPVEELWERVPDTSQQDVDRWKVAKAAQAKTITGEVPPGNTRITVREDAAPPGAAPAAPAASTPPTPPAAPKAA